jgi:low temperature requirement protein LtrA
MARALAATDSLVERGFGLFTIMVLGEVVFGVVDGLSAPDRDPMTITTGMIALAIGFCFWWIYFDVVGRRLPRSDDTSMRRFWGHRAATGGRFMLEEPATRVQVVP